MVSSSEFRVEGMSFLPKGVKIAGAVGGGRWRRNEVVVVEEIFYAGRLTQCSFCLS